MKRNNAVFNGSYAISPISTNALLQRIYVYDNTLPTTQLKNVVILANFTTSSSAVEPNFPYTGTWVNLMDNTTINVTSTTANPITIEAGGYRIYGNQAALTTEVFNPLEMISLFPNPAMDNFSLNGSFDKVQVYSLTGQLVKVYTNTTEDYKYSVSDLNQGIYLVKVTDADNREKTMRLIKQ